MSSQLSEQRIIRVFISSTFRDMQEERDELVKHVFPQLRSLCESRGVVWGEVDLRWGVTDEEKAEGKVLPLCLEEINNCRPYFIGLLGERYGWVPDEIPADIIEKEPWLKDYLGHSLTELEIIHGVLRNPKMAGRAFFYFRDPSYIQSLPEERRQGFIENDTKQIVKLQALKTKIRENSCLVSENYPDYKALGELVLKDMTTVIDTLFPENTAPTSLDRDASENEQYARSRAAVYIGRNDYFDRLDEHAEGKGQALVVLGESGSGKSALLSTWALKHKEMHPDALIIMHFVGATPSGAGWVAMLRRIMGEFKRQFDIRDEMPDRPEELKIAFASWLHMAAAKRKLILIIDALDQLEDKDAAPDLVWLPQIIPENIRLIVSTLPGRPLDEISRRGGWKSLKVEPLSNDEKKKLITEYLQQYSKKLTQDQQEVLANVAQTANPLYLCALLEELRLYGDHFTIDERIKYYLTAVTIDDLYEMILKRYEQDYERERPGLVKEALSILWAARRGLSESELMGLLGTPGQSLPHAYWSPLYLAAKKSLICRSGLLNFSHDYFRKAVQDRYLPTDREVLLCHQRLADYFAQEQPTARTVDELLWHLSKAHKWENLYQILLKQNMLTLAWSSRYDSTYDIQIYWTQLQTHANKRIALAYQDIIDNPKGSLDMLLGVAILLGRMAHFDEQAKILIYLKNICNSKGMVVPKEIDGLLCNSYVVRGSLDEALDITYEMEKLAVETGDNDMLSIALLNRATVLQFQGRYSDVVSVCIEVERLANICNNRFLLANAIIARLLCEISAENYENALLLGSKLDTISRETGVFEYHIYFLFFQASVLNLSDKSKDAFELYTKAEEECRRLSCRKLLVSVLSGQSGILQKMGRLPEALVKAREAVAVCRAIHDKQMLEVTLGQQGDFLQEQKKHEEAYTNFVEQMKLCREISNPDRLQIAICSSARELMDMGLSTRNLKYYDEALKLLKEVETIGRKSSRKEMLEISLSYQKDAMLQKIQFSMSSSQKSEFEKALSLDKRGKDAIREGLPGKALQYYKEVEIILKNLGLPDQIAVNVADQAEVMMILGRKKEALGLLRIVEAMLRDIHEDSELSVTLYTQAVILSESKSTVNEARLKAEEAYQLSKEYARGDLTDAIGKLLKSLEGRKSSLWDKIGKIMPG